mmetsp:Transcript_40551/g.101972  ORF Transcript_40551/g.101972 Transcript_40551/m.101972 type:complete len:363 (-) Transcript_40551:216-1304(-)
MAAHMGRDGRLHCQPQGVGLPVAPHGRAGAQQHSAGDPDPHGVHARDRRVRQGGALGVQGIAALSVVRRHREGTRGGGAAGAANRRRRAAGRRDRARHGRRQAPAVRQLHGGPAVGHQRTAGVERLPGPAELRGPQGVGGGRAWRPAHLAGGVHPVQRPAVPPHGPLRPHPAGARATAGHAVRGGRVVAGVGQRAGEGRRGRGRGDERQGAAADGGENHPAALHAGVGPRGGGAGGRGGGGDGRRHGAAVAQGQRGAAAARHHRWRDPRQAGRDRNSGQRARRWQRQGAGQCEQPPRPGEHAAARRRHGHPEPGSADDIARRPPAVWLGQGSRHGRCTVLPSVGAHTCGRAHATVPRIPWHS